MSVPTPVPFLDLVAPHLEMEAELTGIFQRALRTARFVGGPMLEEFEMAFAAFCGVDHCVGVANGTDALLFALRAAGVASGDVVVTVPNTFIATTEAISQAGALPEFVDVNERTSNISPAMLEHYLEAECSRDSSGRLTSRRSGRPVTAVVPVHLYGQMADMDPILALAERFRLAIVEDACQAHGAEYFSRAQQRWVKAGSLGRAAAFSFYPGKNLGACGEAGAVTTQDATVASSVRKLRDHGQARKYCHDVEGYNGRLDAIQAGILHAKLAHLARWSAQRRERAVEYSRRLAGVAAIGLPHEPEWSRAVYHLYVINVDDRDGLITHLAAARIGAGIHYPIPLHLQEAYRARRYQHGDFPVSERLAAHIVSLPMYPQLTTDQQTRVVEEVLKFEKK
jgi:dTDP-4-amino-4,6-dideoxygalactose transaminase